MKFLAALAILHYKTVLKKIMISSFSLIHPGARHPILFKKAEGTTPKIIVILYHCIINFLAFILIRYLRHFTWCQMLYYSFVEYRGEIFIASEGDLIG